MNLSVASQSFAILFREGLEALLVVSALAAFLRKASATERLPSLYGGAAAAIMASFVMAWILVLFFEGTHSDLFEAGVMALAAILLFYMSGWLFLRQDPKTWQADLNRMADAALGAGTAMSLAAISFLAVFREGAETILFMMALASSSGGWTASLFAGLLVAALALAAIFVLMQRLAIRLPLRPIFLVTSAFLFAIGLKLVGDATQELQEQALWPVNTAGVPGFVSAVGLNGSWDALAMQALVCFAAILSFLVARREALRSAPA